MASWEQTLTEAVTRFAGGENLIENIDHQAKAIEINSNASVKPSVLSAIERAVKELGIGFKVEQLS